MLSHFMLRNSHMQLASLLQTSARQTIWMAPRAVSSASRDCTACRFLSFFLRYSCACVTRYISTVVYSHILTIIVTSYASFMADLDVEALTKGLLDLARDLDQYLRGLTTPQKLPVETLKHVRVNSF